MLIKQMHQKCDICHYWYFKDIDCRYEPYLGNGCHDLLQKAMNFNGFAIIYVNGSAYRILFWYISKDDAINIINNSNLIDRKVFYYFFYYIQKMSEKTYCQRNRDVTLIKKD